MMPITDSMKVALFLLKKTVQQINRQNKNDKLAIIFSFAGGIFGAFYNRGFTVPLAGKLKSYLCFTKSSLFSFFRTCWCLCCSEVSFYAPKPSSPSAGA